MSIDAKLERVVSGLADAVQWHWASMSSHRNCADAVLRLIAEAGLIEHKEHPSGGHIWKVNGKLFGRTDGITLKCFDKLKKPL